MLENTWCSCGHSKDVHIAQINKTMESGSIVVMSHNACQKCAECLRFGQQQPINKTPRNPTFTTLFTDLIELHESKSRDYAEDDNVYSNFEQAARDAGCSVETVFRVLLGIKDARLKNLLDSKKTPNNESVNDSLRDRIVYTGLMLCYRMTHDEKTNIT